MGKSERTERSNRWNVQGQTTELIRKLQPRECADVLLRHHIQTSVKKGDRKSVVARIGTCGHKVDRSGEKHEEAIEVQTALVADAAITCATETSSSNSTHETIAEMETPYGE